MYVKSVTQWERVREKEIHRGGSIVTAVRRSNRARGRCLRVSSSFSSPQIVIMFGVCGLPWFYLVRVSMLIFGVVSLCMCINRILVFCFFHLRLKLGCGRVLFLTVLNWGSSGYYDVMWRPLGFVISWIINDLVYLTSLIKSMMLHSTLICLHTGIYNEYFMSHCWNLTFVVPFLTGLFHPHNWWPRIWSQSYFELKGST